MGLALLARRNGLPLTFAVAGAIAYGLVAVAIAVARRDTMALPGAVISFLVYGTFGYLALRGREWARWVMFALVVLTALTCTFFTFFSLDSGKAVFEVTPVLAAVSASLALIAIGIALPARPESRCRPVGCAPP
jgi:hypothetical protein